MRKLFLLLVVLVGCITATLATLNDSIAAGEARLAALPLKFPAPLTTRPRRTVWRWGGCCSGTRFCRARKMSRARRATIPTSAIPTVLISRSAQTASGLGAARAFAPGHPPRAVKRNSQTVLNVAFNGLTSAGDSHAGGGADVLGSQGSKPREAGARAAQGARGNAWRRVSRGSRASLRSSRG